MLEKFDRDDLVKLWDLVKERFMTTEPTYDKEKELWVELKRLFEPDNDDTLWKLQSQGVSLIALLSFLWSEDENNDEINYKRLQVFSGLDCLLESFSRHENSLTKRIGFMCFFNPLLDVKTGGQMAKKKDIPHVHVSGSVDASIVRSCDHNTTSGGVNIIGGVITSTSSDRTSNTVVTGMLSSGPGACFHPLESINLLCSSILSCSYSTASSVDVLRLFIESFMSFLLLLA
ncbi:hypothetical protein Tco_0734944 [Tanacetum coccineum]